MLLNKGELEILDVFRKNLNKALSIRDIQKISKKASKPYVFNALKKLERAEFVDKAVVGTSSAYRAKFTPQAINYFSLLDFEEYERSNMPKNAIDRIMRNIKPLKAPFCLIVFGSYAKGKESEKSDLDVAIIVGDETAKKRFVPALESIALRELTEIHYEIMAPEEFVEMLLAKEANLGKEIAYHHVLVYGGEIYYQLIEEAYLHGYRG